MDEIESEALREEAISHTEEQVNLLVRWRDTRDGLMEAAAKAWAIARKTTRAAVQHRTFSKFTERKGTSISLSRPTARTTS